MRPTRRLAATTASALVLALVVLSGTAQGQHAAQGQPPPPEGVQDPTEPVLGIASVTPWVTPDGEFQVRFAPTTDVPADALLTVTIHQRLPARTVDELRERVLDAIDDDDLGKVLQTPVTTPLSSLGDPASGATLTIPIRRSRGDPARVLLPNPGIHPVELVLTSPDGPELWSETVFLNRLPQDDDHPPVPVTLVLPVDSGPAVATDGGSAFRVEDQTQLNSVASLLRSVPAAPLTLAVRPNTLDGLARSDQGWAAELLSLLRGDSSANSLIRQPYVRVDSGALVASDDAGELQRQIVVGEGTVQARLDRTTAAGTWLADEPITTESLAVLRDAGVESVLLSPDSLDSVESGADGAPVASPVRLEGGGGMRALAFDTTASERLTETSTDPAVRAHEAVSLLLAGWFATEALSTPPTLASALLLSPRTDARVLESLGATLRSGGPVVANPLSSPLPAPSEEAPTATLTRPDLPDTGAAVAQTNDTRRLISAFRSMAGSADTAAELWDELTNQSMAMTLDSAERTAMQTAVRQQIDTRVRQVHPPRARRVLLTSDDSVIPLRFRNDLPYEVRLVMRARSPRLKIAEPVSEIVLAPGENRVDLEVEVQAPGEFLLRLDLSSPDGGIQIAGPAVPVRSTAISGVGAALSVVSILFLLGWWIHTARRKRRARVVGAADTTTDSLDPGD